MFVSAVVKLKDDEQVLRVVRNHWIAMAPGAVVASLFVAAPFFFMLPLFSAGTRGFVGFAAFLAVGLLLTARVFYVWYWNAFVITSHRVVDVDQRGFLSRTVSEAVYDKIQDVSYAVKGLWGTIFRFGTVDLQTAGASANLELPYVHEPREVHHLITETMSSRRDRANGGARSEKVAHLLETASELTDAEARAFLTAIQEAVRGKNDAGSRSVKGFGEDENGKE